MLVHKEMMGCNAVVLRKWDASRLKLWCVKMTPQSSWKPESQFVIESVLQNLNFFVYLKSLWRVSDFCFHSDSGSGSWSNTFIKYWQPDVARYGLDARDWTWSWQKWNPGPCEGIFETKRTGTRPPMASIKWTRSNFIWRTNSIVF